MRKLVIFLLLALLLTMSGSVMAQDQDFFCGGLDQADCDILAAASENQVTAAGFVLTVDITAEMETISVLAEGAFDADLSMMDTDALIDTADTQAQLDALNMLIEEFAGDLQITIPGALVDAGMGMGGMGGGMSDDLTLELRLIDGVGYINFDTLAPLIGPQAEQLGLTGWGGLDLVDTVTQLGALLGGGMAETDTEGAETDMDMGVNPDDMDSLTTSFNESVTIARQPDANGDAVFLSEIDFTQIAGNELFQDLIEQQLAAQGLAAGDDEFTQALDALAEAGDAFDISVTQSVDLNNNVIERIEVDFALSGAALDSALEAAGEPVTEPTPDFNMEAVLAYSNINQAQDIAAPDAPVVTFMELFSLLMAPPEQQTG